MSNADGAFVWEAVIGFTKAPIKQPMLGQIGCFDQLSIKFRTDVDPKVVEFETNPNFSGQAVPYASAQH